ncbi:tumor necrosis factor ligand superfamily member 13B isoform X2 [Austrofundulus limnaeus]|uniref:Tumor necrosis factor ligand superfamily member 13B isoform X2 n=1 Tax=Austrofundulus limnaeus TaxID=52670 RepID=A0A2I4BZ27_AUSLI|nr:PREDICTED: tumor necrosis factor ligand superfamily member 13B isoform X2 [Austrofundulus limnaeus]
MAVLAGIKSGTGQGSGEKRLSWPVFLVTLAAVTSSSLSVLSLYQLMALRAEVEVLKSDISRRREGQEARQTGQECVMSVQTENISNRRRIQEYPSFLRGVTQIRKRRTLSESERSASQSCLQLLANNNRKPFSKDLPSGPYIGIPWQAGLKRGSALEADSDRIVVREEGFYFVYSQVYYMDSTFTMGHVVIRWKKYVVGNEEPDVHLFRCIQSMNPTYSFNTCYTGGIVKLEKGDFLELLIPRSVANVSLEGDSTFLGAFKLA